MTVKKKKPTAAPRSTERTVPVRAEDLDLLLDCFEACTTSYRLDDWCVDVGNSREELNAAEDRMRVTAGKVPIHQRAKPKETNR